VGCIGPSAVQSGPHTQRFPLVSSPKETSCWIKVWWQWWGARRSRDVVQRAGGRLLWLESSFGAVVVSMLAFGTQVRGFKPSQSRRIFQVKKSSARLPSEGK
jgi:hypothetical protein